ncbi:hypothetical protein QEH59_09885 [Coraliomargarita sp. SDUM461004]|uniref:Uncharacterized protein n=1 Tax=Thalassobacterium sedimentorum TaxID=3041258 RepID=A0ABU1AIU1_9BACT|nr:hypothetical protein [Coraliomargarita sp. SDUM461004]MDQ8194735.1 hypothetical protein [Coraliomargarita sp. SDUM461004]
MIYHYTTGHYAAMMIADQYLHVSDPSNFNDPFEFKIKVDEVSFTHQTFIGIHKKHGVAPPILEEDVVAVRRLEAAQRVREGKRPMFCPYLDVDMARVLSNPMGFDGCL